MRTALKTTRATAARLVLAVGAFTAFSIVAHGNPDSKRVLLLFTNEPHQAAASIVEDAIRTTLQSGSPVPVEIYSEYLDAVRTPLADYEKDLVEQLRRKYAGKKFDVVFSINAPALKLALQNRARLFPDTPIVFMVLDKSNLEGIDLGSNVTGVWGETNYRSNLELALSLHPGTKRVVVITGVGEWDNYWRGEVQRQFRPLEGSVEFSYLTGLSISEQQKALASLPPHTIVIFVSSTQDNAGGNPGNLEVLRQISSVSSAPIYGTADSHLGLGIVGGRLLSFEAFGDGGGQVGLRVLAGEKPDHIAPHGVASVPMFDWRELKRWGIDENILPKGSIVRFKQTTFWEEDKWYIIGAITAILLEAMLIARLLYTQQRRRQAEEDRKRQALIAQSAHRRLDEIVSNVPGIVWETKTDPLTGERKTTYISDYVEKMLGYTPQEWLAQPAGFGARIMVDEDRELALAQSERVVETGQEGFSQFRWRAKDGRIVWTENFLSPLIDSNQKVIGLRGVAIDISDRKSAEEIVRQTKAKDRAILEAVPDLMFLHSPDGTYLDYHCKDVSELSVPPEEFLGKNVRDVLPPDLVQKLVTGFEHAKEDAEPYLFEYELPINGTRRWYEARMVPSAGNVLTLVRDMTERKQAVEALRESEERFRMAQQAARVGTWEWNVRTGESVWSDMIWSLLGLKVGDGPSTIDRFLEIIHPDDRERVWQKVSKVLANGNAEYYDEFRVVHPDAQVLWISSKGRLFRSPDGTPERMMGVNIDINERKLAEETTRQTQQKDAAILEAIPDLMFVQTRDGVYLDYHCSNPRDLFVPAEAFLGKNMREVLPPDLARKFADCFQRAVDTSETQIIEYELPLNGERRWFEARIVRSGDNIVTVVRDVTQRVLSEEAIKTNEAQLSGIIGTAMDGIITVDANQTIVLFNASAERIFGCPASEAVGQSLDRLLPERFRNSHREHIVNFGAKNITRRAMGERGAQLHGLRRSGEEFPMEASISQIEVKGQKFFTVILRDITERKRATDDLRQSEERFSKAFRSNPQPMSITRLDNGLYVDVNESFLAMSGYERSEVVGHTSLDLGIWMDRDHRRDFMKRLIDDGALSNVETIFVPRSGFPRTLLSSAERLEINGQDCVLIASSDVTERVQAQQALKESEARFRNMADTAPVMIWVAGIDKGCYYFNQQWLDFTGRTMAEELGDGWVGGIHSADLDGCLQMYSAAFDSREPFRMEYRLRRADGAYRWVIDSGTPRFSAAGKFLGYIGSCVDITDRKESEAAVIEAHEQLVLAHEEVSRLKNQLQEENIYLQEEIKLQQNFGDIVGASDALKYVLFKIEQVAPTDSTVLITGETGTGKELVARAIHMASARRDRPMVKVNCAALSASLIESELFGHERGAFTGALNRKIGRFELAHGATLFLDEIGELPLELQVKLLRVIQEGELERLGSSKTVKVDVRIIAATNRNLKDQVNQGLFREDLWYRLNVFPITVPPLRQRREDIPMLVEHFSRTFSRKLAKEITSVAPATINALRNYSWPGNVRELANVIERAVINAHGPVLRVQEQLHPVNGDSPHAANKTLEEVERDYIVSILEDRSWKIEGPNGAAHVLGMNPSTLRTRMAKLAITKPNQNAATSGATR
jgi:PAS domain S-box-containing protein